MKISNLVSSFLKIAVKESNEDCLSNEAYKMCETDAGNNLFSCIVGMQETKSLNLLLLDIQNPSPISKKNFKTFLHI